MKRCLAFLLLGLSVLLPWVAFGDEMGPGEGAVPVQSFQEAGTPAPSANPVSPASSDQTQTQTQATASSDKTAQRDHAAQKAMVNAVQAEAVKPDGLRKQPQPTATTPPPVAQTENSATVDHQSATMLQAELTQLNQNNLLFQQQTDERLIQLATKNQQLQQQVHQLTQALMLLNQELAQLKQTGTALSQVQPGVNHTQPESPIAWAVWMLSLKQKLGPINFDVVMALAGLIVVLSVGTLWLRRKKKASTDDDTKDEYDYMGSSESIPAKLNLVRTYIAMEEYDPARKVLNEVTKQGNSQQQEEANELLKSLPAES